MKTCYECKTRKGSSEFHRDASIKDGLNSRCKVCRRKRHLSYVATPRGRASVVLASRRYIDSNPDERREMHRRQYSYAKQRRDKLTADPVKVHCRSVLRNAVQSGRIRKPKACSDCGAPCRVHGHHEDYSKPFQVVWVCSGCHGKRHRLDLAV